MESIFIRMSHTIDRELLAGRISVASAKTMLAINTNIAINLEVKKLKIIRNHFKHTNKDWERDKRLDETFCRW